MRLTCGLLGHSRRAFYARLAEPISRRELDDAYLINALIDAHGDDPEFGYRFLADELERAGHDVGERRVWRLCSQQRLWSTTVRKGPRGAGKSPGSAVHDDHVRRDFIAAEPEQVWVTDITEHPTAWIPAVVATRSSHAVSSQAAIRSAGVSQSRALRGRPLSSSVIAARASRSWALRSEPLGRY